MGVLETKIFFCSVKIRFPHLTEDHLDLFYTWYLLSKVDGSLDGDSCLQWIIRKNFQFPPIFLGPGSDSDLLAKSSSFDLNFASPCLIHDEIHDNGSSPVVSVLCASGAPHAEAPQKVISSRK